MSQQNLVFTNPNEITIPNGGAATTYPSSINVSGLNGTITSLKVTLSNITHTYPDDIDVLLISPTGANILLMSDAGWSWDLNNVTLTFDPNASDFLPDQGQISSGSYRATDYETGDRFNSPAPSGNYGIDFSVFNNTIPNGTWSLYVMDDTGVDAGNIAGGWSIAIDTTEVTTKQVVTLATSPKKVAEHSGANILYTFTRTGNIASELTVNYTVEGSAIFNTDYSQTGATSHTATTGTVSFAAGADTVTLTISPLEDNIQENDETIILTLATATDYIIGTTTAVTGTITNGNDQLEATGSDLVSNGSINGGDGTDRLIVDYSSATFSGLGTDGLGVSNGYWSNTAFHDYRGYYGYNYNYGWGWYAANSPLLSFSNIETFEITGTAYADYLRGYSGDDKLIGGEGNDDIAAGDGSDIIRGGDGNDTLKGEGGNDEIEGGDGNDNIAAGDGNDLITGGEGNDTVKGEGGNDEIESGNGNDNIAGGDGNDLIRGGDGNDTLKGESGNDEIEGGDGNDSIDGGTGRHLIRAGTGDDTVAGAKAGDSIDGGEGNDTLQSLDLSSLGVNLVLDLRATEQVSGDNNTRINNFENISSVTLGSGDDTIIATSNLLVSNGSINAGGGTDRLIVDYSSATFSGLGTDGLGVSNGYWSNTAFHDYRGYYGYNYNYGWGWYAANSPLLSFSNIETFEITGTAYADYLRSYGGDDTLIGGEGNDDIAGGDGSDIIRGGDGNDTLKGEGGNDEIEGGDGNNTIDGGDGNDLIRGGDGNDILKGEGGNDEIESGNGNDNIAGGDGNDLIRGGDGNDNIAGGDGNDLIRGGDGNDTLKGEGGNDEIESGNGNDSIDGGTGRHLIRAGTGDDTVAGAKAGDSIDGGEGNDTLQSLDLSSLGVNLVLDLRATEQVSGDNNTRINNFENISSVTLGSGYDTIIATSNLLVSNGSINAGGRTDRLIVDYSSATFSGLGTDGLGVSNGYWSNTAFHDYRGYYGYNYNYGYYSWYANSPLLSFSNIETFEITGTAYADYLRSYGGDDTLIGGEGNDDIAGGDGSDIIRGGDGNDTLKGEGGNDEIEGGDGNNTIDGGDGNDLIRGGDGNDILKGEGGNDEIESGNGNDNIAGGDGNDLIRGGDGNDTLKGEGGNDEIEGGDGNDSIDGGTGRQVIRAGTGDDTVAGAKAGDSIDGGEGNDTLQSLDLSSLGVNLVLDLRATEQVSGDNNTRINNFENISSVTLGSGYDTIIATSNLLVSNGSINAGGRTDRLIVDYSSATFSGLGTDGLGVSNGYWSNSAFHDYRGLFSYWGSNYANSPLLSFSNIETFEITGTAYADYLRSYGGDDKLIGGEGNDDIAAGDGSDLIIPVNANVAKPGLGTVDTVTGGTGKDTFILGDVTWIGYDDYNPTTAGTSDYLNIKDFNPQEDIIQLLGSSSDYTTTVSGNNINLYINKPDSEPDELIAVLENTQGLINPLQFNPSGSYFKYVASNTVLNITSTFTSGIQMEGNSNQKPFVFTVTRTGNTSVTSTVDWFITPSGNNPVNSTDFLGGAIPPGDGLTFLPGETSKEISVWVRGDSTIEPNETFTVYLSTPSRSTIGTRSATGIILNDDGSQPTLPVIGTSGNDTLNGTINADFLMGLAGNDTYTVNNAGDLVVENLSEGTDRVNASISYTLADNVENLTFTGSANLNGTGNDLNNSFTGNTGNNILTGLAGNDVLDGKVGADTLIGGLGNDTYTVDNAGDVVTENLSEGTDLVNASISYTLTDNVENLTLTGSANLNGTGNDLNNSLTGNTGNNILTGLAGNDVLDGKVGADTLIGGLGNDTYTVDNGEDVVTENLGEGTDLVNASISYTLIDNVENLTFTGSANLNATGNNLNNSLTGNTGNNILNGGAGTDTLRGGVGSDIFVFQFEQSPVSAADRITDFAIGTDKIDLLTSLGVAMNAPTALTRAANSTATTLENMVNSVFTDANGALTGNQALGVNSAALVSVTTSGIAGTYLVINDGVAGFQSSNDLLVNITGYSGTLPALGTIAVSSFFI